LASEIHIEKKVLIQACGSYFREPHNLSLDNKFMNVFINDIHSMSSFSPGPWWNN